MTSEEILKIESELGITLPNQYRSEVNPHPIQALRGNSEWMFWDDADKLIALNKRMREGERFRESWPARFYAMGEDAGGCSDAIDLEDPEFGVFWFDRQHIDVGENERSGEKLDVWITRQIADSTHDLESEGIDPSSTPEEKQAIQEKSSKGGCLLLLFISIIAFFVLTTTNSFSEEVLSVVEDEDIIFHRSTSRQSHAIAAATESQYTHMGIIFHEKGKLYVYEAVQPVKKTKLVDWINRGKDGKFIVRRLKDRSGVDISKLKREVSRFIDLDYDYTFAWSDSQIYCSELVWKAYYRSSEIKIGELKQLKDFNLRHKAVRKIMKERYGDKIPWNMKVISPSDIFRSSLLKTVGPATESESQSEAEQPTKRLWSKFK